MRTAVGCRCHTDPLKDETTNQPVSGRVRKDPEPTVHYKGRRAKPIKKK